MRASHPQGEVADPLSVQFEAEGYLVLPEVFPAKEIDHIKCLLTKEMEPGHAQAQTTFFDLTGRYPYFSDLVRSAGLVSILGKIIGGNLAFHHSKLHCGERTSRWHRDICSYPHTNSDLVTVSLYLDDVDLGHGALQVIPGSHRKGSWTVPFVLGSDFDFPAEPPNALKLEVAAGGISIHHCCLLHRSSSCAPGRVRNVIVLSYRATDAAVLVPDMFGEKAGGVIVAGNEPISWRVEDSTAVFAEECVAPSGRLISGRRERGLRIRGSRCSMM